MNRCFKRMCLLGLSVLSIGGLGSCGDSSSDNTLIIGLECNYAPFNWTESASNDYTLPIYNKSGFYADGYDIQISKKLSEITGMKVEIYQEQWESLTTDIQTGTINCIIAGMTDTEEREQAVDFTDEYYRSELVLVTKKSVADTYSAALSSSEFTTLINGKMIESQNNTVTDDVIDTYFVTRGAIHNTPVTSFALAAQDVVNGSAFAMTAEYPVAQSIVASNSSLGIVRLDQSILGDSLKELGVSIGLQKGSSLKATLNSALAQISQDDRNTMMSAAVTRSTSK